MLASLVGGHVHVQVGDHQGVEQVRAALDQGQAGQRAHGLGQQDHLVDAQMLAEELDDLDGVGDPAVEGHLPAASLAVAAQGLARPAVVPLDHGEKLLPGSQGQGEDRIRPARPTVQDQQDRVAAILTAELEPLVDATDGDEALLDDPVWGGDLQRLGHPALTRLAPGQPADRRCGDEGGRAAQHGADHGSSFRSPASPMVSGGRQGSAAARTVPSSRFSRVPRDHSASPFASELITSRRRRPRAPRAVVVAGYPSVVMA